MREFTLSIPAGEEVDLFAPGDYIRIKSAAVPVVVENRDAGDKVELSDGDDARLNRFNHLALSHASASVHVVKVMIGAGTSVGSARIGGSIAVSSLTPSRFTGSNTQKTVTTASALLVAANANRAYLLIQNKDATGNIWIAFNASATPANGVKLGPGQSYELNCNIPTAVVYAIGDVASNSNVVVVEG